MIAPQTYLLDGPLSSLPATRERKIGQMATELLAQQAFCDRHDATRVLRALGYPFLDVALLVDEAMYLAQQEMVGREMGDVDG